MNAQLGRTISRLPSRICEFWTELDNDSVFKLYFQIVLMVFFWFVHVFQYNDIMELLYVNHTMGLV